MSVILNAFATRGGGPASRLREVTRRAGRAWNTELVLVRNRELPSEPGVTTVTLPGLLDRLGPWTRRLLESMLLRRAVRRHGATAVVHYGSYVPMRRVPGVRNVLYFVNLAPWDAGPGRHTLRNRILRRLFELTVTRADLVIVQSSATRDFLRREYPRTSTPMAIVHNGCAVPELERATPPRDFVIVGHLYRYRRVESVVQAYAALPPGLRQTHRLVLVGDLGRDETAVRLTRQEIERHQLNGSVQLLGPLPREQALRKVVGACAFVSFSAVDNGPNAVQEAAALGVPLILSDIPVHRELASERASFASDVRSLTDAMAAAAHAAPRRTPVERRAAVDTWDRHVAEVGRLLRELGGLP